MAAPPARVRALCSWRIMVTNWEAHREGTVALHGLPDRISARQRAGRAISKYLKSETQTIRNVFLRACPETLASLLCRQVEAKSRHSPGEGGIARCATW